MKPLRIYTQYRKGGIGACMSLCAGDLWGEAAEEPHVYCAPPTSLFPWSFHTCGGRVDDYVGEDRIDRRLRLMVRRARRRK